MREGAVVVLWISETSEGAGRETGRERKRKEQGTQTAALQVNPIQNKLTRYTTSCRSGLRTEYPNFFIIEKQPQTFLNLTLTLYSQVVSSQSPRSFLLVL